MEGDPPPVEVNSLTGPVDNWTVNTQQFLTELTNVQVGSRPTFSSVVQRVLNRSRIDLAGLCLQDRNEDNRSWMFAAGVPTYVAFFGRDSLVTAWEAALLNLRLGVGTLRRLAAT